MRVVRDELPDLPSIDIMLYGEEKFGGAIAKALVNFVLRSVQEQESLMMPNNRAITFGKKLCN